MKSVRDLLDELNTLDENDSIEAKRASSIGTSIMETVSAFSNEPGLGGGYLLLGVAEASNTFWPDYEVVGVDDPDKTQRDLASLCSSAFNIPVRPKIQSELINGKPVVIAFIPEAATHEKPIHFKNKPLPQSAFRRIGSSDQSCVEDDLIVFYTKRQGHTHDEQILQDAAMDDFDEDAIEQYRRLRADVNPDAEELTWDQDDLLTALGAVRKEDDVLKPTVAGILLFGKAMSLRRLFPMLRIDYIRIPGNEWVKDPDRRFDTVEIRAPLVRAIQRARTAVLDDLPKMFSLPAGAVNAKEVPRLPDRVVREVVANAVMHRDYRVHGSIQIIRYSNRLEVRNPGFSLKSEQQLGQPGSENRNPKIAAVLHELNFAETKGSGIRVMRELMDENDLSPPLFQSDRSENSFFAMLLFHHFLSQDDIKWLSSFEEENLSQEEMKAMISAREVGAIDNRTYRDLNRDDDTLSASKHLRRLCKHDLLEKKGSGTGTYYVPTPKALKNWPPGESTASVPPESVSATGKPVEPDGKSIELDGKSVELDGKSVELPQEIRQALAELGGKAGKPAIQRVILKLLAWQELSVAQLAECLNRTPQHVRQEYLPPMLKANLIKKSNPDNPTDPRMTYSLVQDKNENQG